MIMSMMNVIPYQNNNEKSDYFGWWYFRAKLFPTIKNDELLSHIASDSRLDREKVPVVNSAVTKQVIELLCNGHQLNIPHIGTLRLSISSKGTKTAQEYHAGQCITKVRLVLTPCKEVKDALKKVKFRKVYYTKKGNPGPEPPTP